MATCRTGDQVYGGGAWMENNDGLGGAGLVTLEESAPSGDLTKWYAKARNDAFVTETLHAYAMCGTGPISYQ
jgi:hypothetical protein